ncbi:MAG: HlyD family efflux transporter periplasmic adaptor subunit [Saprospiraceae bacterium]|nr:HlyD family efflux transporter periplasmic adaptor subunit [Saprospiraceae bacterium]
MRFNLLYIFLAAAIAFAGYIIRDLNGQGEFTFFGTAESETRVLNLNVDVVIQSINIKSGQFVKAGDTLLIAYQRKDDQDSIDFHESNQISTLELANQYNALIREKKLTQSEASYELAKIESELSALKTEDSLNMSYRKLMSNDQQTINSNEQNNIEQLNKQLDRLKIFYKRKIDMLNSEAQSIKDYSIKKNQWRLGSYLFNKSFERNLTVIAPIDGFIDQISVQENSSVQAYRDLLRINPKSTSKIIGFIHENSPIVFQIGDSVMIQSTLRFGLKTSAIIASVSPKLVELPLRLRKFVEVRAWGREVYIYMNENPGYYIGEKVSISLKSMIQ